MRRTQVSSLGPTDWLAGGVAMPTSDGTSGEELEGSQMAILVSKLLLHVGVRWEVDGREGDVSQETSLCTLQRTHTHTTSVQHTKN